MATKKGRCHICAELRTLTKEHVPPQSAGNSELAYAHTLEGMAIGAKVGKPPPPLVGQGGIKRTTVCSDCNRRTAEWYNEAFKDWTNQARVHMATAGDREYVSVEFVGIRPLKIIKQIAVSALATALSPFGPEDAKLRRFVLYSFETGLPPSFEVRSYYNLPRKAEAADRLLTTRRLTTGCMSFDVHKGTALHCFAEVGHNPLGYLTHLPHPQFRLPDGVQELRDIGFLGNYEWTVKADITLTFPVRTPFGPAPGYYVKVDGPGTWDDGAAISAGRE